MKLLIEVRAGCVTNVWASEPEDVEVVIRDMDEIDSGYGEGDPLDKNPGLAELRTPHFVIY